MRKPAVVAASLAALALTACGGGTSSTAVSGGPERAAEEVAAPASTTVAAPVTTTTIPVSTTSTTTVRGALDAAFSVQSAGVVGREFDYSRTMYLGFAYRNLTSKQIVAFQFRATVEVKDRLGRSFVRNLLFDCTDVPLAAGGSRRAGNLRSLDALIAGEDNCTVGGWHVNPYISSEIGMYEALVGGAQPSVVIEVTRVVMADGSAIGTPVVGSRF